MTQLIDYFLALGKANPVLVAILLGTVSGWATATIAEYLLAGSALSHKAIKNLVIVATVIACGVSTELLWGVFDKLSDPHTRRVVCYVLAPISPFSYIWVAKIASKYVPWINSIWSLDPPKE
jgi:hypothetical protein